MKNLTVYVGTIKRCLDLEGYKRDGDSTFLPDWEMSTGTSTILSGFSKPNTKIVKEQAILIKNKHDNFYEFKLTNTFFDNLKIIFNLWNCLYNKPWFNDELFYDEKSLVPYYEEQPKKLSFRKLKNDLLCDPRIKTGIEH